MYRWETIIENHTEDRLNCLASVIMKTITITVGLVFSVFRRLAAKENSCRAVRKQLTASLFLMASGVSRITFSNKALG